MQVQLLGGYNIGCIRTSSSNCKYFWEIRIIVLSERGIGTPIPLYKFSSQQIDGASARSKINLLPNRSKFTEQAGKTIYF